MSINELVARNVSLLSTKSHNELFRWAREHGFDNANAFGRFKRALLANGINYDALRHDAKHRFAANAITDPTHDIILYADYHAGRYAVTDAHGTPIWHGHHFNGTPEQERGELDAALKAVWLAGKVRDAIGAPTIRLHLSISGFATPARTRQITDTAARNNIRLTLLQVSTDANLATSFTHATNYKSWKNNDLTRLASPCSA